MPHHHGEEADDDLGAWPDQHLALASLLCIADALQSIGLYVHVHHRGDPERWQKEDGRGESTELYTTCFLISLSKLFETTCISRTTPYQQAQAQRGHTSCQSPHQAASRLSLTPTRPEPIPPAQSFPREGD